MKHLLLFLAALVAMPPAVAGDYMSLRLMTYNVHNCIGTDRQTDIERIAAIVRRQAPDVVAVQEGHEGDEAVKALVEALTSDEVKAYIEETYEGAVVPLF